MEMGGEQGGMHIWLEKKEVVVMVLQLKWLSNYRDPGTATWVPRLIHYEGNEAYTSEPLNCTSCFSSYGPHFVSAVSHFSS